MYKEFKIYTMETRNRHLYTNIASVIEQSQNILLVTHDNPDLDAVSSVFAMSEYLGGVKSRHAIFFKQIPPKYLLSLDPYKDFSTSTDTISNGGHDFIMVFDSGDMHYTGVEGFLQLLKGKATIINIDHHETNSFFGDINVVDSGAVSTTEIIYNFFHINKIFIRKKVANHLLAGIIGDTNNFTNFNTTPKSFTIASMLTEKGAQISQIISKTQQKKSMMEIRDWGKVLSRLIKNNKYNIAYTVISQNDVEGRVGGVAVLDGLSNYLNNVSDVKISMVIREMPDNILKISMRTNDDLIDVSKFAKMFNGGGHKKAAGFSIKGKLEKTEKGWRIV